MPLDEEYLERLVAAFDDLERTELWCLKCRQHILIATIGDTNQGRWPCSKHGPITYVWATRCEEYHLGLVTDRAPSDIPHSTNIGSTNDGGPVYVWGGHNLASFWGAPWGSRPNRTSEFERLLEKLVPQQPDDFLTVLARLLIEG